MNKKDILDLVEIMDEHSLSAVRYDDGKKKIELERQIPNLAKASIPAMADRVKELIDAKLDPANTAAIEPVENNNGEIIVKNPMVGTFFVAPSPDEEPFVKVGSEVLSGQTLGIVEAMKMMNEISAPKAGVIAEIYVENEEQVEYDQPLFKIVTGN